MNSQISRLVGARAQFCCEYCFSPAYYCPDPFELDHIEPVSKGGETDVNNLAYVCSGCNGYKYNLSMAFDPGTGEFVPLYNPRIDEWSKHFCWDEGFVHILGISPTGRATVARLRLNRPHVINLRRLLIEAGEHPPIWF